MAEADPLPVETITKRTLVAARSQWRLLLVVIALDTIPYLVADLASGDWTGIYALMALATLYLQLLVTIRTTALIGAGPLGYANARWTEGRYPGAFLMGLLTSLAIGVGALLFVLPGIALWVMWSIALPALVAERLSATAAMWRSWDLVRSRFGRMLMLSLPWFLLYATVIGVSVATIYWPEFDNRGVIATLDIMMSTLLMTSAIWWAVVYGAVRDDEEVRAPSVPSESTG